MSQRDISQLLKQTCWLACQ